MGVSAIGSILGGAISLLGSSSSKAPDAPAPIPIPPPPPPPAPERGVDPDAALADQAAQSRDLQRRQTQYMPSATTLLNTTTTKKSLLGQ